MHSAQIAFTKLPRKTFLWQHTLIVQMALWLVSALADYVAADLVPPPLPLPDVSDPLAGKTSRSIALGLDPAAFHGIMAEHPAAVHPAFAAASVAAAIVLVARDPSGLSVPSAPAAPQCAPIRLSFWSPENFLFRGASASGSPSSHPHALRTSPSQPCYHPPYAKRSLCAPLRAEILLAARGIFCEAFQGNQRVDRPLPPSPSFLRKLQVLFWRERLPASQLLHTNIF